jgi:hypothetical protein
MRNAWMRWETWRFALAVLGASLVASAAIVGGPLLAIWWGP